MDVGARVERRVGSVVNMMPLDGKSGLGNREREKGW